MAAGDWHQLPDGTRFQETLHGPNIERECIDCGHFCYAIPDWPVPRCEKCLRKVHSFTSVGGSSTGQSTPADNRGDAGSNPVGPTKGSGVA